MEKVDVMIVEDDPFFSAALIDIITLHFPYLHVSFIAESIVQARYFLMKNQIDLLFLDIELQDGKGFELLSNMELINFEVIITTSHSSYAIDAIHHSALDYLLKPVSLAEMEVAMAKFIKKSQLLKPDKQDTIDSKPVFQKLPLPTSEGFVFVNINEIVLAEADRNYAVFSMNGGGKLLVSKPLGDFEERLAKHNFFRVHKSHIINLHEVSKYVRGEGGYVVMTNKSVVPVSRSRKDGFLRIIGI